MQNKIDGGVLCFNDPAFHRSVFFRALGNAVKNGSLPKWKADELKREYNLDMGKEGV